MALQTKINKNGNASINNKKTTDYCVKQSHIVQ